MAASTDAAARPAGRARLSALHRGTCLGDRTPPLSFRPRFTFWWIVTSGPRVLRPCGSCTRALHASLWTLSTAKMSRTPGRPVVMPVGSMPEAARERGANPPAGTALAPHSGLPSGKRPFTERDDQYVTYKVTIVNISVTNIFSAAALLWAGTKTTDSSLRGAKRRSNPALRRRLDCFATLAMTREGAAIRLQVYSGGSSPPSRLQATLASSRSSSRSMRRRASSVISPRWRRS